MKNIPRDYKALVGYKLWDDCLKVMRMISRANRARTKSPHLVALVERLQQIELLLRLSCDKRLISKPQYARAIELTTSIGKQANGWRRKETSPASSESRLP